MAPGSRMSKESTRNNGEETSYHLILLAKDLTQARQAGFAREIDGVVERTRAGPHHLREQIPHELLGEDAVSPK